MPTYYTPTPRQIQEWKINAHLRADQPPAIMRFDLPLWAFISAEEVETAYRLLVLRHAALRTCFPMVDGQIVQAVVDYDPETFQLLRLRSDDADLISIYRQALAKMKDVATAPLVRSALGVTPSGPVFILMIQHMLCDAWSMKILEEEMQRLCYSPGTLPETYEYQLVDYFERNKDRIAKAQTENLTYWMQELADRSWSTDFNGIYLNSLGQDAGALKVEMFAGWEKLRQGDLYRDPRGYFYSVFMPESLFAKLADRCVSSKVSIYSVLVGCWAVLGMELTGNKAILIRSLWNNRFDGETRNIVGNLIGDTFLVLRLEMGMTLLDLVAYCYREAFQSMSKVVYNSEALEDLHVLTHCFMLFNFLSREMKGDAGKAKIGEVRTEESNQVWSPLFCDAEEFANTISFRCGYHAAYLDTELVEKIFDRYFDLLGDMLEHPHMSINETIHCPQDI